MFSVPNWSSRHWHLARIDQLHARKQELPLNQEVTDGIRIGPEFAERRDPLLRVWRHANSERKIHPLGRKCVPSSSKLAINLVLQVPAGHHVDSQAQGRQNEPKDDGVCYRQADADQSSLTFENIADPVDRVNELFREGMINLLTQISHVGIDRIRTRIVSIPYNLLNDLPRKYAATSHC